MFLHRGNNIEHDIKAKYLYWHGGNLFYTSMILYIKTVTLKMMLLAKRQISKVTCFLKSIAEDEDSQFYFLYFRS